MLLRSVISWAYFALFVGGLGWAEEPNAPEAVPPTQEHVLRLPDEVHAERVIGRNGDLQLRTLSDLRDTCESFDGYRYEVKGQSIVIDSFVVVERNRLCADLYRDNLPRDYQIKGLDPRSSYRIFFRDDTGSWVDYGVTSTM